MKKVKRKKIGKNWKIFEKKLRKLKKDNFCKLSSLLHGVWMLKSFCRKSCTDKTDELTSRFWAALWMFRFIVMLPYKTSVDMLIRIGWWSPAFDLESKQNILTGKIRKKKRSIFVVVLVWKSSENVFLQGKRDSQERRRQNSHS